MSKQILIYIPCHSDIEQAINQARSLRINFTELSNYEDIESWELVLVLAINDYTMDVTQKSVAHELFDEIIDFDSVFLFDANICGGFLYALKTKPNFFWILSTNDTVNSKALNCIVEEINKDPTFDLIVANKFKSYKKFTELYDGCLFDGDYHFGLISGVIYNFERIGKYFNSAPFFLWTGWGHLSVIYNAIKSKQELEIISIPESDLFFQEIENNLDNRSYYSHSYFGSLILQELMQKDTRSKRKLIRKFILRNFHLHAYFSRSEKSSYEFTNIINKEHYLGFNIEIAESMIRSKTPFFYIVYSVLKKIRFDLVNKYIKQIRESTLKSR
jgi:hypothetical protein